MQIPAVGVAGDLGFCASDARRCTVELEGSRESGRIRVRLQLMFGYVESADIDRKA
jgi:hypothetical protein